MVSFFKITFHVFFLKKSLPFHNQNQIQKDPVTRHPLALNVCLLPYCQGSHFSINSSFTRITQDMLSSLKTTISTRITLH